METELLTSSKLVLAGNAVYILATNATKASLLTVYIRVFSSYPCDKVRLICWFMYLLLASAAAWGVFGGAFMCQPAHKYWRPRASGHCSYTTGFYWDSTAAINVGLDLAVFLLPMPLVCRLKLPRRQMIAILVMFALGGFTCIASILRFALIESTALKGHLGSSGIDAVRWSAIEANTGIICASLLCMKPLVRKMFPRLFNESSIARSVRPHLRGDDVEYGTGDSSSATPRRGCFKERSSSIWSKFTKRSSRRQASEPSSVEAEQEREMQDEAIVFSDDDPADRGNRRDSTVLGSVWGVSGEERQRNSVNKTESPAGGYNS